jgi:carbon-monoxide dehydrogenase large subunit
MFMPSVSNPWVGQSLKRKEDRRLIIGDGQYLPDLVLPRMVIMGLVRSIHAHAKITRIDTTKAAAFPGVSAVITGDEFATWDSILNDLSTPNLPGETKRPIYWPLARGEVKYVGDPIVAVAARDKYILEDALELVDIDYDPLPVVVDPEQALQPGAPRLYPEWGDNILYHQHITAGDASAAFAQADVVLSERFRCHRTGGQPMETRGCLAIYNPAEGLTLWLTTQRPHIQRHLLAEYLKIPHDKLRVIMPKDMGGAFGTKAPLYREEMIACHLAMKLRRPVKWVETRRESLMNVGQGRDQIHQLELALKKDGTILAVRDKILADCGDARTAIYVGFAMPFLGAMYLINGYDIPVVDIDLTCVVTNKASLTPSRAFGSFAGRFAIDRIVELAANALKIDPVQIRLKNAIKTFPHVSAVGVNVDSGDFLGAFAKACTALQYDQFRTEQAEAWKQGRYLGVGFCMGVEISGVPSEVLVPMERQPGFGVATVQFDAHGKVQVAEGDSPHGQGHETTIAQAVAGELGISPDDVYVTYGDTHSGPFSAGTIGSRGASYTLSAAVLAARALRPKMSRIAAHLLHVEAAEDEFEFRDGYVALSRDLTKRVPIKQIAEVALLSPTALPPGMEAGLEHTSHFEAQAAGMHSCNVHAAMVEVFPDTGAFKILRYVAVDDAGAPINPMVVRGQVHGGVAMGIGNACFEEFLYDENGQQLTTTLMDYHLPSALDLPNIETIEHNVPSPHTPLGSKGKGEGTPGMVPAALANAIEDALRPFNVKITQLPLTPERIWRLIQEAKERQTAN